MKAVKLIIISVVLLLLVTPLAMAAEWSSSECYVSSRSSRVGGNEYNQMRVTAVSDGSAGTVTLTGGCAKAITGSFVVQVVVDPDGTLTAAANFTLTDGSGGILMDTDDFTTALHVTNTTTHNDTDATLDGDTAPLPLGTVVLSFDDIGDSGDTVVVYLYGAR